MEANRSRRASARVSSIRAVGRRPGRQAAASDTVNHVSFEGLRKDPTLHAQQTLLSSSEKLAGVTTETRDDQRGDLQSHGLRRLQLRAFRSPLPGPIRRASLNDPLAQAVLLGVALGPVLGGGRGRARLDLDQSRALGTMAELVPVKSILQRRIDHHRGRSMHAASLDHSQSATDSRPMGAGKIGSPFQCRQRA